MLLPPRKNGLTSLFKEVRVFKGYSYNIPGNQYCNLFSTNGKGIRIILLGSPAPLSTQRSPKGPEIEKISFSFERMKARRAQETPAKVKGPFFIPACRPLTAINGH